MGQIKNIKLHIVTDIKTTMTQMMMLNLFVFFCLLATALSVPIPDWKTYDNEGMTNTTTSHDISTDTGEKRSSVHSKCTQSSKRDGGCGCCGCCPCCCCGNSGGNGGGDCCCCGNGGNGG